MNKNNLDGSQNKYFKKAPQMRKDIINKAIQPFVKQVFEKIPECNSVLFFVAQYWDDESVDVVHYKIILSTELVLNMSLFESNMGNIDTDNHNLKNSKYCEYYYYVYGDNKVLEYLNSLYQDWDSNGQCISAFASYCQDGGSQNFENILYSYSLYSIFKRTQDNNSEMEVVGKMHRPYLEGVAPNWEQEDE